MNRTHIVTHPLRDAPHTQYIVMHEGRRIYSRISFIEASELPDIVRSWKTAQQPTGERKQLSHFNGHVVKSQPEKQYGRNYATDAQNAKRLAGLQKGRAAFLRNQKARKEAGTA